MKKSKSKIAVRQVKFKAANTAQIGTINILIFKCFCLSGELQFNN